MLRLFGEKSWPVAFAVSLLASLSAQGPLHTRAVINDSRSHGKLGDGLLSLNEGILLHNLTLTRSQLSAAELKQIQGVGDIATLEISATTVPKIALERDLVLIKGSQHGFTLEGAQGMPIIDFGAHGEIKIVGDYCAFRNLHFRGGQRAIHLTQNDVLFGALFEDMRFEGQAGTALTVMATQIRGNTRMLGSRLPMSS
ncbi:MAG: hypothetical protein QF412_07045 [Planctomycetota bacterium]|jgi:hypothetical protein|nr:hypothetical protein [Planctomycetota bacterium]